ncbi:MAG: hypothetical protein JW863_14625 [Chitinispirillaceae bacterium]|nr:hypothetical protein [Chitinispirillaceae bacterium]
MADVSSVSSSIDLLTKSSEPYTATAAINDGFIDAASSTVTGDRTTGLFDISGNNLGKDDFLTLLVTQLQYQDPLNPMENTEFISQLAQFSALENSTNVEKAIGNLGDSFKSTVEAQQYSAQSMNNTAAVSLIGKEVRMRQTTVNWYAKAGVQVPINVHLGNNNSAVVEIVNRDGEVVKTLRTTGKDSENSAALQWDGTTDTEEIAPSDVYEIRIQGQEEHPELYAFAQDVVEGVRFSSEGALVKIAGQELSIGNVLDVSIGGNNGITGSLSSSSAVALLGKEVRMRQTSVSYRGMANEQLAINVEAGARQYVQMELIDSSGRMVYAATTQVDEGGLARFSWNGLKNDGSYADPGEYRIRFVGEENDQTLYAFSEGIVSGIANLGGDARLRVGNYTVPLSSIIDIAEAETEVGAV